MRVRTQGVRMRVGDAGRAQQHDEAAGLTEHHLILNKNL